AAPLDLRLRRDAEVQVLPLSLVRALRRAAHHRVPAPGPRGPRRLRGHDRRAPGAGPRDGEGARPAPDRAGQRQLNPPARQVPTRRVAERSRRNAIVERYDSFPVREFSDGTFSISIVSRPNSPCTVIRWRFSGCSGDAKMRIRVFSGPMPARDRAATTLTFAGKARHASVAVPSKINVSRVIESRSIFCDSIHGAPARPRGGLRVSIVTESIAPTFAPLTPSSPAIAAEGT